jgi:hypothetical protein
MPGVDPMPALASVCGLYCGACSAYLATREDPARLEQLASRLGQTPEETRCEGCRSGTLSKHCRSCKLAACATERGHAFCGECPEFPCAPFEAFRSALPHRRDILADMSRITGVGTAAWLEEIPKRYACEVCGTINSAYDLACRFCRESPGNDYIREHGEAIRTHLSRRT